MRSLHANKTAAHPTTLTPKPTACIIHESLGHAAEADQIIFGSKPSAFQTLPSVSDKVTVIDYAYTAFGKPCPLPMYFDDEGTATQDVCIINKGRKDSCMTDKFTAALMGTTPTGNARSIAPLATNKGTGKGMTNDTNDDTAEGTDDEPMVRMRNTALLPGDTTPEEMLASMQDGYHIVDCGNIYGDGQGGFKLEITEAYRVHGGVICEKIPQCMAIGNMSEFLQSISMVGNDFEWFVDECTKGDTIQVGQGAPTVKARLRLTMT